MAGLHLWRSKRKEFLGEGWEDYVKGYEGL